MEKLQNKKTFNEFLEKISDGWSVYKACQHIQVSNATFYKFIEENPEANKEFCTAKEIRGDRCIDKIEEFQQQLLLKEIDPATARVLIDTEKWKACKFYPKMYGDKQEVSLKTEKTFKDFLQEIVNNE